MIASLATDDLRQLGINRRNYFGLSKLTTGSYSVRAMSLPKWVTEYLASRGESEVRSAERLRREFENHPKRDLFFGFAQHWEEEGKRLIEIAKTGTDDDKERALGEL